MAIIGFDVSSTATGWAIIGDNGAYKASGTIMLPKNAASKQEKAKLKKSEISYWHYHTGRLHLHARRVATLLGSMPGITTAVVEDVVFKTGRNTGSLSTLTLLAMYFGITVAVCQEFGLELVVQLPSKTRKAHGLPGNAEKELVLSKARSIVGKHNKATNPDELDAIALAYSFIS